ncbi:MAG: hypothetical protein U9Q12_03305 [Patescibacteria group bacterium]|nr:hypothetical protein [Patescibacteria group bacterium]
MKKMFAVASLMFFLCISVVQAADYVVQVSDVIGTVAEKTGSSIEQLALLNDIMAPDYIIRVGTALQYVDNRDVRDARQWIEDRLATISMSEKEQIAFEKMLRDIDAQNISYGSEYSTDASEILVLAQAYRATK